MARSARPQRSPQRGFSLLEFFIVVIIIGGIAAYVGPKYFSKAGKAEAEAARAQMAVLQKALDTIRNDIGRYPTTAEGLEALDKPLSGETSWNGPYLSKPVPLDPWNHPYVYTSPASRGDYEIRSYGKDGKPGGMMEDTDLVVGR